MKTKKFVAILTAALLTLSACGTTAAPTTQIGTVNGKAINLAYYEEIFGDKEATTSAASGEATTDAPAETETPIEYDKTSAMLMSVFHNVFKETGHGLKNKKDLNGALNNLKAEYGDDYLKEAEKNYLLPIKTEADLINVLTFSIEYSKYIEDAADITAEEITEFYEKNYQTQYCASHLLTKDEASAQTLLDKIKSGEKTFTDYEDEGKALAIEQGSTSQSLNVNEVQISGVQVSQLADLGCASADNYVGPFAEALKAMEAGTVSETLVKTDFGYHIIDLREIKETKLTKAIESNIKANLVSQKQQTPGFSSYYLTKLLEEVTIDITDEKVKPVYDEYIKSLTDSSKSFTPEEKDETKPAAA